MSENLDATGTNNIFFDKTTGNYYQIKKSPSYNGPSIVSGPYITTTGPTMSNYGKINYMDINMDSERGAGHDYIRKCVRDVLLDKDSFPEEREALLGYLQSVLFDMIEPEQLEEIQRKFSGISLGVDKRILELQEELSKKDILIDSLRQETDNLRSIAYESESRLRMVQDELQDFKRNFMQLIREEVKHLTNPRY